MDVVIMTRKEFFEREEKVLTAETVRLLGLIHESLNAGIRSVDVEKYSSRAIEQAMRYCEAEGGWTCKEDHGDQRDPFHNLVLE